MRGKALPVCLLALLMLAIGGCNKYGIKKRGANLQAALTSYEVALRWAEYQTAYNYHISPNGARPPANLERLAELSVTGVKQIQKTINEDHTEAMIKYVIAYYIKTQGIVRELRLEHKWWVNEETGQWFIDGAFPDFF